MTDTPLTDLIDDLAALAEEGADEVALDDVLDTVGDRGAGIALLVPGLMGLTPVSAIPGVPSIVAAVTALLAVQIVIGRDNLWLPGILRRRALGAERFGTSTGWLRDKSPWVDRHFGRRLVWLTGMLATRAAGLACLVIAPAVPPIDFIPGAGIVPMGAIAMFGLALTLRDGALMLLAWALFLATGGFALWLIL